jgi:glycosyltransferase involved in cell wall biosynthesis
MVSHHCCARVIKEGLALEKRGIKVTYMQNKMSNTMEPSILYRIMYHDVDHFTWLLKRVKDVDVIHVHNEPDWMGHISKAVHPNIPVVFDAHDLFSVRVGEIFADEKRSFEMCDAFIYPSVGYMNHALKNHSIQDKPNEVIYSMCNIDAMAQKPLPQLGGLVYEGGLRIPDTEIKEGVPEEFRYHNYRNFNEVFRWLTEQGFPVVAFAGNPEAAQHHGQSGALVMGPLDFDNLIRNLTRFHWGLVGSPIKESHQWHTAMPHKLFEYIIAGIPVITWDAEEIAEFVNKHQIGIVVDDYKDIPDVYNMHSNYKKNVEFLRGNFVMERQIQKLIKVYNKLL